MFKKSKKYLSFILSLCMIVSMFVGVIPTAYADGLTAISPTTATFDVASPTDITVTITPNGNTLTSIKNGETTLTEDKGSGGNYSVADSIVTIKQTYLSTLSLGDSTLTFNFDNGNPQTTIITVRDTDKEAVDAEVLKYETTATIASDVLVDADIDKQIVKLLGGQFADETITITRAPTDGTYLKVSASAYQLKAQKTDAGNASETATLTFKKNGKTATLDIDVTIQSQLSSEKAITSTTIGTLAESSIIDVPTGTKVDALKSALTVSDYANVEILNGSGGFAVVDQVYADVTSSMVIEVTAQDSSKAEYAIAMQAVLSNDITLTVKDASVVKDITGTVITVANAVYTQELVNALDAPVGGSFELQNADGISVPLNTDTTLVVEGMKVVVTAADNTTANYTITVDEAPYSVTFTIIDSLSNAIKGATVEFNEETLLTDTNGKVTFNNVANGTELPYTVSKSTYVDVIGTVDINDANLILSDIELVKNEVVFNVYNDSDQPIENATVTLGALTPETTDELGSVTFTGVEDGTISYTVEATGYTTQNAQITVAGNNVTQTLTMFPESATTYTITFVVKDGEDLVDGASVSLIDHGTSTTIVTATTESNGKVIFDTIYAGNYDYSITATGFAEKTGSISVVDTNLTETVSIDYIPVETSVVITGSDTLESKLVGFVDYPAYTAVVNDQRNVEMVEQTVVWSIKDTAPTGVNIDSSTGVVTVHDTATAGSFTIVATSITDAEVKAEKSITITKEVVVPVITIIGADNATVKLQDDSTEAYTYEVKDQYNRDVEGQTVTWSLKTPVDGVSVDANGLVTISTTTADSSFILVATLDSDGSVTTEETVTLTKEIQVVTSVEIRDGVTPLVGSIEVETDLNTLGLLTHKDYNVVVKDQYGTVMDGKTATITLKNPVANLTVEPNGTNIFRFGGGGFTGNSSAILVATSDDDTSVSCELTVNITFKSKFTVVSEFLNDQGDVTVSLTPGRMIYANCDIENKTDDNTEVLMIFAVYKNGIKGEELKGISAVSKVVNARSLEKMKAGFLLPSDLTGYTVRVFVWDGNDIVKANKVLSNLIQIP